MNSFPLFWGQSLKHLTGWQGPESCLHIERVLPTCWPISSRTWPSWALFNSFYVAVCLLPLNQEQIVSSYFAWPIVTHCSGLSLNTISPGRPWSFHFKYPHINLNVCFLTTYCTCIFLRFVFPSWVSTLRGQELWLPCSLLIDVWLRKLFNRCLLNERKNYLGKIHLADDFLCYCYLNSLI